MTGPRVQVENLESRQRGAAPPRPVAIAPRAQSFRVWGVQVAVVTPGRSGVVVSEAPGS